MTDEQWMANLTRRIEDLERWRSASEAVARDRGVGRKSRQWAVNTALTAVNTMVLLLSFWLSHK
jgi:hypothetical protein